MKSRNPSQPPPSPLSPDELGRVHQWQLRMIWFYGCAMICIAGGYYLMSRFADVPWLRPPLLIMLLALLIAGAVVQFRERCPRCGTLLGRQSRLILPNKCKSCGVGLRRAAEADHAPRT
jgi:hypothetical protein